MKFLVDVHCHLARPELQNRVDELIRDAFDNNVKIMIVSVQTETELRYGIQLHQRFPLSVFLTLGQELTDFTLDTVNKFSKIIGKLIQDGVVVGIGEIGLDFAKVRDPLLRNIAKTILEKWFELAKKYDLPVVIHSRRAHRDVIELLKSYGLKKVVLHAFAGGVESAKQAVDEGYYFSIPPSIVHSKQKQKLVREIPLDRLLLESDCPELGPEFGAESKPSHVRLVAQKISEIKGVPEDEVIEQTTKNALSLFGITPKF